MRGAELSGDRTTSMYAASAIWDLARLARAGDFAAGRELIRRVIVQCDHQQDPPDPQLSQWLKDFLSGAMRNPRHTIARLIAPPAAADRQTPTSSVRLRSLNREAYVRVCKALDRGLPRKRVFNDVARELNALGYRNPRNEQLRASSVERRYYEVRRRKNAGAAVRHRRSRRRA